MELIMKKKKLDQNSKNQISLLKTKRHDIDLEIQKVKLEYNKKIQELATKKYDINNQIESIKNFKPLIPIDDRNNLSVCEVAMYMGKGHITPQGQIKYVKRKLKGVRPLGLEGKDYRKIKATQSHVNDQTADYVGQEIYTFIQSRTRFSSSLVKKGLTSAGR